MVNLRFENKFVYAGIQDLAEGGSFRRYVIPEYFHSNKGNSILIKDAYDIFKNGYSFDGFYVYKIVFSFSHLPQDIWHRSLEIEIDEDFKKYESFITTVIQTIDVMGLFLNLAVLWAYPDKQHSRTKLYHWKKEVLKDNVCACCGGNKHLEAHHIFSFAEHEELRDDPNNGIALCKWCHKKYHSYYPGDANPVTLIKFLKRFGGNHE